MDPKYPYFKKVQLSDKALITAIAIKHPPYCDFNFTNIYNWSSPKSPTVFSILNGNLVIRMKDFVDDNEIVSFIGSNGIIETVKTLLYSYNTLTMVPDCCITDEVMNCADINIEEDINNLDYILSLEPLLTLSGRKYKSKRKRIRQFKESYPEHRVVLLDLTDRCVRSEIVRLTKLWGINKGLSLSKIRNELCAIERAMGISSHFNFVAIGVYVNECLVGYTINECAREDMPFGGFGKSDVRYVGAFPYLEYMTALELNRLGYKYLNYEQDLGIPNLRKAKLSWRPVYFLKKYKITKKR
ncbi:DUF2156 domain-containing protein [candidate division WWE3 bacterium]|nr:DUF2156 domain-containing protein [candidate division WWE3 bacterium]